MIKRLVWGNERGRTRRHLILAILELSLLGGVAIWAQPYLNTWLYPPPPPPPDACTQMSIFVSGPVNPADTNRARKWVNEPNTTMILAERTYANARNRVEFWITDGTTIWEIEIVCFDQSEFHYMVYGEFYTVPLQEVYDQEQGFEDAETGA